MKLKFYFIFASLLLFVCSAHAQLELTAVGSPSTIDFTGFMGDGFAPDPTDSQLDSDTWSVTGMSDGDVGFGETGTTGDFARGSTTGMVTTGGVYAADILGNQGLMVQPGTDDFTPGSFVLKLLNITDVTIGELAISYTLYILNDQGRANSFNLSYSYDNITWVDVAALDYTSGEAATGIPSVVNKDGSIAGLVWENGDNLYVRWKGDDVSGSGSRDEFALDDIAVTGFEGEDIPVIGMAASTMSVSEDDGSISVTVTINNDEDCTINVFLDVSSTADNGTDFSFTDPTLLSFTEGGSLTQSFSIDITDDVEVESVETIVLQLADISGTCIIGVADMTSISIEDNDVPVATESDIADVTGEDAEGYAVSDGELVVISGIVYGGNLKSSGLEFTLIDETGGIKVFSFSDDLGYTVTEGDELTITGTITQFNGLTEIEPSSLELNSSGNTLKIPSLVTTLNESTESDLVRLENCSLVDPLQWLADGSSFNVDITCDGSGTLLLRIDDLVDLSTAPAPDLSFNLTGIGSQFDSDAPYLDGYQILPRYTADLELIPEDTTDAIQDMYVGGIRIYPNPVADVLYLSTSGDFMQYVVIRDLSGKLVYDRILQQKAAILSLENLPAGTYYIQVESGYTVYGSVLLKQ